MTVACPHCKQPIPPRFLDVPKPTNTAVMLHILLDYFPHGCQAEREYNARVRAASDGAEAREREAEWQAALQKAGLTGWLAGATFENFAPRQDWEGAMFRRDRVMAYAHALLNGEMGKCNWLILHGGYGAGKSHLAASVIYRVIAAGWKGCYFRVWTEYLQRIQASWDRNRKSEEDGESEADITAELMKGRLVVIDDLDKRPGSEWSRRVLFTALNHRLNEGMPTILTFNYGPGQADPKVPGRLALLDYVGEAVLDRIVGTAFDLVEFDGPSYRSGVDYKAMERSR